MGGRAGLASTLAIETRCFAITTRSWNVEIERSPVIRRRPIRLPWKVTFVVERNLFLVVLGASRDGSLMKLTGPGIRSKINGRTNLELGVFAIGVMQKLVKPGGVVRRPPDMQPYVRAQIGDEARRRAHSRASPT